MKVWHFSITKSKSLYLAIENSNLTIFSESPRYLEVSEDEDTLKKLVLHSVATALASIVFPVPGGPIIKTPFKGRRIPWISMSQYYAYFSWKSSGMQFSNKSLFGLDYPKMLKFLMTWDGLFVVWYFLSATSELPKIAVQIGTNILQKRSIRQNLCNLYWETLTLHF